MIVHDKTRLIGRLSPVSRCRFEAPCSLAWYSGRHQARFQVAASRSNPRDLFPHFWSLDVPFDRTVRDRLAVALFGLSGIAISLFELRCYKNRHL